MGTVPKIPPRPRWVQELLDLPDPAGGLAGGISMAAFVFSFLFMAGLLFLGEEEIWEAPLWLFLASGAASTVSYLTGLVLYLLDQPRQEEADRKLRQMIRDAGGTIPRLPWEGKDEQ